MTYTLQVSMNLSGSGASIEGSVAGSGDSLIQNDIVTANGTVVAPTSLRAAGLSLIYIKAAVACTVTFRDIGGVSVGSKTLVAGVPFLWVNGLGTIPISDDAISYTVVASAVGAFQLVAAQDGTPAAATAALSGTLQATHLESGIVTGGYTAILTLTGAQWQPAGAAFDNQRQAIINGFVSAQSETNGWNAKRSLIAVTAVVRTSATVVTVTLPAIGSYDITANETITVTVPAPATTADLPIVASPTAVITAGS